MDTGDLSVKRADFPSLYRAASDVSGKAQKTYLYLNIAQLTSLAAGGVLTAFSVVNNSYALIFAVLTTIAFFINWLLTFIIQALKKDRDWYAGRALGESVKTLSWRFIMCAEPYGRYLPSNIAEKKFLDDLKVIENEKKFLAGQLTSELNVEPQITDKMMHIRTLPVPKRLAVYIDKRIIDQQKWYNVTSSNYRKSQEKFSIIIYVLQFITFAASIHLILNPTFPINVPSIFVGVIGVMLTWLQLKRYQELSQLYGVAAQELSLIYEDRKHIETEEQLSTFVVNSENAISREHTLWIARKGEI